MRSVQRKFLLALAPWLLFPLLSAKSAPLETQVIYETGFEAALADIGWNISDSLPKITGAPRWNIDANGPIGGGPVSQGFSSLNFNDGVDYQPNSTTLMATSGNVTSPDIDLSALITGKLTFSCNYQTETPEKTPDQRRLLILKADDPSVTLLEASLATNQPAGIDLCPGMAAWHSHTVILDPTWGIVRIRFRFNSVNTANNAYPGWFIDDLKVAGEVSGGGAGVPGASGGEDGDSETSYCASVGKAGAPPAIIAAVFLLFWSVRRQKQHRLRLAPGRLQNR